MSVSICDNTNLHKYWGSGIFFSFLPWCLPTPLSWWSGKCFSTSMAFEVRLLLSATGACCCPSIQGHSGSLSPWHIPSTTFGFWSFVVVQSFIPVWLCNPMDCSMPGFPVLHYFPEFAQAHVYWVDDAIQPSHPLSPASPTFNLSQHQGLFQWVSALHKVA